MTPVKPSKSRHPTGKGGDFKADRPPVQRKTGARQRPDGRSYTLFGTMVDAPLLEPGLYIVSTPIGNLEDISLRALRVLAACDRIWCEDKRITRRLLDRYAIDTPLGVHDEHQAARARPVILQAVSEGGAMALVSDAGTPLISDPGFKLVREAGAAGLPVFTIPGASALTAAAAVSGLPTDRLHFAGFVPSRAGARDRFIAELADVDATLILYEAPGRVAATMAALAARLGDRDAAVARELTKLHEEVARGTLAELAARYATAAPRGECVVLVAPGTPTPPGPEELDAALHEALGKASVKDAVANVARALGLPRRRVYERALVIRDAGGTDEPD